MHYSLRLTRRFSFYTLAGVTTFAFDLVLLSLVTMYTPIPQNPAIAGCYLIAVTINFFLCHYLVYRGTEQNKSHGYGWFVLFAIGGAIVIMSSTTYIAAAFAIPLLIARTIIGTIVGIANFLLNTYFNFRLV